MVQSKVEQLLQIPGLMRTLEISESDMDNSRLKGGPVISWTLDRRRQVVQHRFRQVNHSFDVECLTVFSSSIGIHIDAKFYQTQTSWLRQADDCGLRRCGKDSGIIDENVYPLKSINHFVNRWINALLMCIINFNRDVRFHQYRWGQFRSYNIETGYGDAHPLLNTGFGKGQSNSSYSAVNHSALARKTLQSIRNPWSSNR